MNIKLALRSASIRIIDLLADTLVGDYLYPLFAQSIMRRVRMVPGKSEVKLLAPNSVSRYRINTFLTKEPETLEWIERMPEGSVLWDIGANVGLYTCFAAKVRKCRVFAFEPSVLNLELLARNIHINDLSDIVTIVPLAMADGLSFSTLNMSSMEWGGAKSTFKENYGHDGKTIDAVLRVPTIGLSMVEMVQLLKLPQPNYIKMDVDGIEHLILRAGGDVLRNAKEILVEINDDFHEQADLARRCLVEAGFQLQQKRHAAEFDNSGASTATTFNQIWVKR